MHDQLHMVAMYTYGNTIHHVAHTQYNIHVSWHISPKYEDSCKV